MTGALPLAVYVLAIVGIFAVLVQQTYRHRRSGGAVFSRWLLATASYVAAMLLVVWLTV